MSVDHFVPVFLWLLLTLEWFVHTHTHTSKVAIDGSTPRISFVARAIFIDINVVKDDRA